MSIIRNKPLAFRLRDPFAPGWPEGFGGHRPDALAGVRAGTGAPSAVPGGTPSRSARDGVTPALPWAGATAPDPDLPSAAITPWSQEAQPLARLRRGQAARVVELAGESGLRHRLEALGLRPGQRIQVLRRAPWGGPLHLQVGMTELMLRRRDAARIAVAPWDPRR
jgi:ferrous iron transport protein A